VRSLRTVSLNSASLRATARLAPAGIQVELFEGIGLLPLFNPELAARIRTTRPALWLRSREHRLRATEWPPECSAPLWVPGTTRIDKQPRALG